MNQNMEAYKNEIFGPVLCVLSVDTLKEAIELVNRCPVFPVKTKHYLNFQKSLRQRDGNLYQQWRHGKEVPGAD